MHFKRSKLQVNPIAGICSALTWDNSTRKIIMEPCGSLLGRPAPRGQSRRLHAGVAPGSPVPQRPVPLVAAARRGCL